MESPAPPSPRLRMPYIFFGIICLLFGSNFYLMKLASSAYGPATIGAGRLLGGAGLLLAVWAFSKSREHLSRREAVTAALIGFVGHSYPYAMQPALIGAGLEHSFMAMMVSFTPMSIMLFSAPLLGVWPTQRQLVGVFGGLGFLSLLMFDGHVRGYSPGVLAIAITAPLSYGVANCYLRKKLHHAPPLAVTMVMLGASGLALVPLAWFPAPLELVGAAAPAEPTDVPLATAALFTLGVLGTGLTMWLWVTLVSTQGPLFVGMVTYVVPVMAMMWGVFDGERVTLRQIVAIIGVLAMVALVQYNAAGKPAAAEPTQPDVDPPECDPELACAGSPR